MEITIEGLGSERVTKNLICQYQSAFERDEPLNVSKAVPIMEPQIRGVNWKEVFSKAAIFDSYVMTDPQTGEHVEYQGVWYPSNFFGQVALVIPGGKNPFHALAGYEKIDPSQGDGVFFVYLFRENIAPTADDLTKTVAWEAFKKFQDRNKRYEEVCELKGNHPDLTEDEKERLIKSVLDDLENRAVENIVTAMLNNMKNDFVTLAEGLDLWREFIIALVSRNHRLKAPLHPHPCPNCFTLFKPSMYGEIECLKCRRATRERVDHGRVARSRPVTAVYTSQETRAVAYATADASTGRYWELLQDGSMVHQRPNSGYLTTISPQNSILAGLLPAFTFQAFWVFTAVVNILTKPGELTQPGTTYADEIDLYDLAAATGRRVGKDKAETEQSIMDTWKDLVFLSNLNITGSRTSEKAHVAKNQEPCPVNSPPFFLSWNNSDLMRGTNLFDLEFIPAKPTVTVNKSWIDALIKFKQYLPFSSEILAIPTGKPSGALAKSAAYAIIDHARQYPDKTLRDGKIVISPMELFGRFPTAYNGGKTFADLLEGKHAARTPEYGAEALRILAETGLIEMHPDSIKDGKYYKNLEDRIAKIPKAGRSLAKAWADAPIEITLPSVESQPDGVLASLVAVQTRQLEKMMQNAPKGKVKKSRLSS
jgi:hypothetical protein